MIIKSWTWDQKDAQIINFCIERKLEIIYMRELKYNKKVFIIEITFQEFNIDISL